MKRYITQRRIQTPWETPGVAELLGRMVWELHVHDCHQEMQKLARFHRAKFDHVMLHLLLVRPPIS